MNTVPTYAPAESTEDRRNRTFLIAGLGVVALLVLLAGGLLVLRSGSSSPSTVQASSVASKQVAADAVASTPAPGTDGAVAGPAGTTADNTNTTTSKSTGNGTSAPVTTPAPKPAPPAPAPPAPKPTAPKAVITSFSTPQNIDCHNGNSQTFTASWTTTNAVKVTIAIDGPGIYNTYAANGSDSLPFSCSSAHTYLLTAFGQDGKTVSKSITLQPRNVQIPTTNDEDQ